ncbi:MAG: hypothetical protein WBE18_05115, partial [Gammaproteobacteria bacterium]
DTRIIYTNNLTQLIQKLKEYFIKKNYICMGSDNEKIIPNPSFVITDDSIDDLIAAIKEIANLNFNKFITESDLLIDKANQQIPQIFQEYKKLLSIDSLIEYHLPNRDLLNKKEKKLLSQLNSDDDAIKLIEKSGFIDRTGQIIEPKEELSLYQKQAAYVGYVYFNERLNQKNEPNEQLRKYKAHLKKIIEERYIKPKLENHIKNSTFKDIIKNAFLLEYKNNGQKQGAKRGQLELLAINRYDEAVQNPDKRIDKLVKNLIGCRSMLQNTLMITAELKNFTTSFNPKNYDPDKVLRTLMQAINLLAGLDTLKPHIDEIRKHQTCLDPKDACSKTYDKNSSVCKELTENTKKPPTNGNVLEDMKRGQADIGKYIYNGDLESIETVKERLRDTQQQAIGKRKSPDERLITYVAEKAHQGDFLAGGASTITKYVNLGNPNYPIYLDGEIGKIKISATSNGSFKIDVSYLFNTYKVLNFSNAKNSVKEIGNIFQQVTGVATKDGRNSLDKNPPPYLTIENSFEVFINPNTNEATHKVLTEKRIIHQDIDIDGKKLSKRVPWIKKPDHRKLKLHHLRELKPKQLMQAKKILMIENSTHCLHFLVLPRLFNLR